ncbi:MAG: hypothetical protein FJ090_03325 [Deltaproteobacteria bacterium]|nr:hypothetical protein [Deltaproteobacteria bacterium]
MTCFLLLAALSGQALADEEDDFFKEPNPEEKKGANADVPDATAFHDDEEEFDIPTTPRADASVKVDPERDLSGFDGAATVLGRSTKMPVDVIGAKPLADNWAPVVVYSDTDAVVVELPVLYAKSKADFDGVAYWLVAEVYADGKKVSESRASVTRDSIAGAGPSVHFFRLFAPVPSGAGVLEVRVGKAASGAGKAELLFTRSAKYALGK